MRVIGIDTASATASVALVENGLLLSERTDLRCESTSNAIRRSSKNNHAETILPLIELLFESTGVSLQDITGFALSIGPGSFTGLRIGLSTVKGLVYGSQIPVVGMSTLFAHAARVTDYDGLICALLDARKNEVYAALFRKTGNVINRVTEDTVASAANVIATVREFQRGSPCLFVGGDYELQFSDYDPPTHHLAIWRGDHWEALPREPPGPVYCMTVFDDDGAGPHPPRPNSH